MWINGYNSNQFAGLHIENGGGGTYNLMGDVLLYYNYTGPSNRTIGNYASIAVLVAAAESFIEEAGLPWLIVGDLSTVVINQVVAINFANLLQFGDTGTGIEVGADSTNGYAPWANYSDARAGILELLGNKQI